MLITAADFGGDYRLFNANNLDPDTIRAIDEAQEELARDLFPVGFQFILGNNPTDPPNLGLRQLGLHRVFIPWTFMRLEGGIAGAGIKKTSDVPGRTRMASGAFFSIARNYRYFIDNWNKYEGFLDAVATAPDTLSVAIIVSSLLAPGMEIEIDGVGGRYSVTASSPGVVTISPNLPASSLGGVKIRQVSLRATKDWVYL